MISLRCSKFSMLVIYFPQQNLTKSPEVSIHLTLCLSYLNPYCLGRITAFFQWAFKFPYCPRNRSPLHGKKIITIKLKKDKMIILFYAYL
jgi:hypothetical protein